ncbi:hypothetical protein GCM10007984_28820 [Shewanella putrefaciens]|nr:hypothetical protein GCM10007984_28820 [Shewanella putrefaciens]
MHAFKCRKGNYHKHEDNDKDKAHQMSLIGGLHVAYSLEKIAHESYLIFVCSACAHIWKTRMDI